MAVWIQGVPKAAPGTSFGQRPMSFFETIAAVATLFAVSGGVYASLALFLKRLRTLALAANLLLVVCSIAVLFSAKGLIARIRSGDIEVERTFNRELNEDPSEHKCFVCGSQLHKRSYMDKVPQA